MVIRNTKRFNKEAATAEDPSNKYEEDVQHCGAASSPITGIRWKSSWQVWWDEHDQKMHNMTTITNVSKKSGHKMIGANQPTNHSHRWAAAGSELVVFVFGDWSWTTYTSAPSSSSSSPASSSSSSSSTLSPILRVSPFVEIFNFHLWFVTPSFILFQQTDWPVPAKMSPAHLYHIDNRGQRQSRKEQLLNSKKRRRNVIFSANERPRGRKTRICQIMSSNRSLSYVLLRNVDFTEVGDFWLWSQRI